MKISAAIITKDAAADIGRCLESLACVDEIVVLDTGSRDDTVAICRRHGATVHAAEEWLGFGKMKAAVVALTSHRWVLSIDADEELTPELNAAINNLPDEPDAAAFACNRLSRFLGKWIRHCGWYPDLVVRLFHKERARFNERLVHEAVEPEGPVQRLDGLLLHYTYENLEQYLDKLNRYTSAAAAAAVSEGRSASVFGAFARGKATFLRMWLLQAGFLDGWHGFALCLCSAYYVFAKYLKIWRMGRP
ncbi:MAG: glycosyltransferase family 2 protein [bacterium]